MVVHIPVVVFLLLRVVIILAGHVKQLKRLLPLMVTFSDFYIGFYENSEKLIGVV